MNPGIGLQQKIFSKLSIHLSAGTGFKAPGYKNRYQVFVNPLSNYKLDGRGHRSLDDRYDDFVAGYFLLHATLEKRFWKDHLGLRITADNLLNYTDRLMPAQPGRILLIGVQYRFGKRLRGKSRYYFSTTRQRISKLPHTPVVVYQPVLF